jgi:hypothetical protein
VTFCRSLVIPRGSQVPFGRVTAHDIARQLGDQLLRIWTGGIVIRRFRVRSGLRWQHIRVGRRVRLVGRDADRRRLRARACGAARPAWRSWNGRHTDLPTR